MLLWFGYDHDDLSKSIGQLLTLGEVAESGLRRRPAKAKCRVHRGFKSRPLRWEGVRLVEETVLKTAGRKARGFDSLTLRIRG
jgi:hypothetical protein